MTELLKLRLSSQVSVWFRGRGVVLWQGQATLQNLVRLCRTCEAVGVDSKIMCSSDCLAPHTLCWMKRCYGRFTNPGGAPKIGSINTSRIVRAFAI